MKRIRECSTGLMYVLGLCVVIVALVSSGCSQGGDGSAFAAPQNPTSAPVTVVNTADNPVPVTITNTDPAFQPFTTQSNSIGPNETMTTVPAGKLLVIESVTAISTGPPGTLPAPYPVLHINTGNQSAAFHHIAVEPRGQSATQATFFGTHAIRLYAGPLTQVVLQCAGTPGTQFFCQASISGHFVNVP